MGKHAYLVIAHNNFEILKKLLKLLDDYRNDIYLHIDKKVIDFDFDYFQTLLKRSKVYFVDRHDVMWGHYSLIETELELYKAASKKRYEYYHLLSGVDLPLKNQNYIHAFFDKNKGTEFITCATDKYIKSLKIKRRISANNLSNNFFKRQWEKIKIKDEINFKIGFGSSWCSLTHNAVSYILSKEDWIYDTFKDGTCCDEVYKQSIIVDSEFNCNIYRKPININTYSFNMRFIKWNGGAHPYTWRNEDFKELIESDCLFARKFDYENENIIVDKIYNHVKK